MQLLAGLIKILHLAIVVAIIAAVFVNSCLMKQLALTVLLFLLVQYLFGFEKCGLTELEYMILGEKNHKQGFIYRLINPVIKVPEKYFYNGILFIHLALIGILICQIYHNC